MHRKVAYLAGPMQWVSEEEAQLWRAEAELYFTAFNIDCLDPTHRAGWADAEIVQSDITDIQHCHGVLAHVPLGVDMTGTSMEIFYANYILRKPVVLWGRIDRDYSPWHRFHSTGAFNTLEEAADSLRKLLHNEYT